MGESSAFGYITAIRREHLQDGRTISEVTLLFEDNTADWRWSDLMGTLCIFTAAPLSGTVIEHRLKLTGREPALGSGEHHEETPPPVE